MGGGGGGAEFGGAFDDFVAMGLVDIADGDVLDEGDGFDGVEEIVHAAACADDADAESVIGAENAGGGECGKSAGDHKTAASGLEGHGAPEGISFSRIIMHERGYVGREIDLVGGSIEDFVVRGRGEDRGRLGWDEDSYPRILGLGGGGEPVAGGEGYCAGAHWSAAHAER